MTKFLTYLSLVILSFATSANSQAAEKENLQAMKYDVYAGGIHALEAKLITDLSLKNRYDLSLRAKTYGMLGKLAPWNGAFLTQGWKSDTVYKPEIHQAITTWKDETETKTYRYKNDGSFESFIVQEDDKPEQKKEATAELSKNTSDVLTATLSTMKNMAAHNKCEGSTEVFDGKRRFKLIFKQKKEVTLESSRYNIYSGPAIECTAEVEPVAGKWREKPRGWMSIQEQGRERGTMPTVWLAQVHEGQVAVPVKVRVKTSYGTLFMHLTEYKTKGKKLSLKD